MRKKVGKKLFTVYECAEEGMDYVLRVEGDFNPLRAFYILCRIVAEGAQEIESAIIGTMAHKTDRD